MFEAHARPSSSSGGSSRGLGVWKFYVFHLQIGRVLLEWDIIFPPPRWQWGISSFLPSFANLLLACDPFSCYSPTFLDFSFFFILVVCAFDTENPPACETPQLASSDFFFFFGHSPSAVPRGCEPPFLLNLCLPLKYRIRKSFPSPEEELISPLYASL